MRKFKTLVFLICCCWSSFSAFAQMAKLRGQVKDEDGYPLSDVLIRVGKSNTYVNSDSLGFYSLELTPGQKHVINAVLLGFQTNVFHITPSEGELVTRDIVMILNGPSASAAYVRAERSREQVGTIEFTAKNIKEDPNPIGGVEGKVKTLVGSRNETSSQYNVRGGNFDENLVYVNGFEINRPFLVRSGQQEGLSFINSDMVSRVEFSVGGFQARYGDKMSSVLDVHYKRPAKFAGSAMASLLGFQAHVEGATKKNKLSYMVGLRQKSNQYLLRSQPVKGQYNPSFTDLQALLNYRFSPKWEMEFIGNYALNKFHFVPASSRTTFGSVTRALAFTALYDGQEISSFDNAFGGLSLTYKPNPNFDLRFQASMFGSYEQETYDIRSLFMLSEVELNLGNDGRLGEDLTSLGSGMIHRYARNFLAANVANYGIKAGYRKGAHTLHMGANLQQVHIYDRLLEWERRDSAGFSIPYDPKQVNMYKFYEADNELAYEKVDFYLQDNILLKAEGKARLSLGLRGLYNFLNKELVWSPRANLSFKPDWDKDMIFKIASGVYAQPAFYREMRDRYGNLNTDLKAQKSWHVAGGMDYNFMALNFRPFKFTVELFYKQLWDLVPYDYDNVRIRYAANNDGRGYAYGAELRLFGDLVKDAESWLSIGYLRTMEQIYNHELQQYGDWQPRPTDGRVTFGLFFSDYFPQNQNFKVFLNMMYATGLPAPLPGETFERKDDFRITDYKRMDIGFSALLLDASKRSPRYYSLFKDVKSIWASLEVFNLMAFGNTLSYEYIESMHNDFSYYIPNRLTNRLINLKLAVRF